MSRRKLEINQNHCTYKELEKLYHECKDAALKMRLLAILQTWDGIPSLDVAKNLHKSDAYVRKWIHKYNEQGTKSDEPNDVIKNWMRNGIQ